MDPIVAAATPWGRSALAIVRVSGGGLRALVSGVVRPMRGGDLPPGRPRRVELFDGHEVFDDGVATWQPGPSTATGEELLEITTHGNPLIVGRLVDALVSAGARVARAGEFTRRAVLHGRLDLLAAEAVDQVIRATTPGGLRLGRAGLTGALAARIDPIRRCLLDVVAELEARLDYPDDELALLDDTQLAERLTTASRQCRELAQGQAAGSALVHGVRIALVGEVNAGKSSLFNRLLGRSRALVHALPGTTRDVIETGCDLGPLHVVLLDTAGERTTEDPVEAAGLALARELIDDADLLLVVLRAQRGTPSPTELTILHRVSDRRHLVVYNGIDREDVDRTPVGALATSARTGAGIAALQHAILAAVGVEGATEPLVASARQRDGLLRVADAAEEAVAALPLAGVAVAADLLTHGVEAIDGLTGADTREDVLDAVFARFCIGK